MSKHLSKKEIRSFLEKHPELEGVVDKKSVFVEKEGAIYIDGTIAYRSYEKTWVPALEFLGKHKLLPCVVVDKGAPPFIAKGADLMRPGVVRCEEFAVGALVVIVDEVHGFPLATGKALFSSEELLAQEGGKVVKVLFNLKS